MRILWLQRWVVVGAVALVVIGALAYQATVSPRYESSATLQVSGALVIPDTASGVPGLVIDPSIVDSPTVRAAAAETLGRPPDTIGAVSAEIVDANVVLTANAAGATDAKELVDAFAPAVAAEITAKVPTYLQQVSATVEALRKQADAIIAGTKNPLLAQAQSDVIVEQYSAAYKQQSAVQAAKANPVLPAALAQEGSLTTLSRMFALQIAVLAGLIVGVGVALLRNWLDGRIDSELDVQNAVDVPVLGVLPLDRGLTRLGRPTVDPAMQSTALVEDIRRMRTAATGGLSRNVGSIILVTSLSRSDGATFVTANLGAASARAGHLTVVASGDLRDPELTEYFGIVDSREPQASRNGRGRPGKRGPASERNASTKATPGSPATNGGVSRGPDQQGQRQRLGLRAPTLQAEAPPERQFPENDDHVAGFEPAVYSVNGTVTDLKLRPTGVDGLSILLSLVGPGEGPDALASERVGAVIEAARARSELVVIDSPPLLDVADPLILAPYADLVVVVARSHSTRAKDLTRAVGILNASGVSSVGVVVNAVRRGRVRASGAPINPDRSARTRRRAREDA